MQCQCKYIQIIMIQTENDVNDRLQTQPDQRGLMEGFEEKPDEIALQNLDESFSGGFIDIFKIGQLSGQGDKNITSFNEDTLNRPDSNLMIERFRYKRGEGKQRNTGRRQTQEQFIKERKLKQSATGDLHPENKIQREQTIVSDNDFSSKAQPMFKSLKIYLNIKLFFTRLSVKRKLNVFFKSHHFQMLNDKAAEKSDNLAVFPIAEGLNSKGMGGPINRRRRLALTMTTRAIIRPSVLQNKLKRMRKTSIRVMQFASQTIKQFLRYIPLFYPESKVKICWDLLLCWALMYFFVVIPLEIFFNNNFLLGNNYIITIIAAIFMLFDYLFKLNTVYYQYGKPVTERSLIFQQYLRNGLIIDGLTITMLFIYIIVNQEITKLASRWIVVILILTFSQFKYLSRIQANFQESISIGKNLTSLFDLLKLILTMLYTQHIFSCIWYFIADVSEYLNETNWLRSRGIVSADWSIQYLQSFYFSTVTMFTVGYGDIVPQNSSETILSILFMMFASIQISYSVNTVGTIIKDLYQGSEQQKVKIRIINKFMTQKKITFGLQYQIREYLKTYWEQEQEQEYENEEEKKLISTLSVNLRNRLIHETNESLLQKCPFFKNFFSVDTKGRVLSIMQPVVISPESVIDSVLPTTGEPCLCFIDSGELDVCFPQSASGEEFRVTEIQTLKPGQYFGLEEFITGSKSKLNYVSQTFVKLIVIRRSEFLKILKENPTDYEQYCQVRDEQNKMRFIVCTSCNEKGHSLECCPIIHFNADREKIIKQYQFPALQQRRMQFRNQTNKNEFYALTDQWAIKVRDLLFANKLQELADIFQSNNNLPIQDLYDESNEIYHNSMAQNIELQNQKTLSLKQQDGGDFQDVSIMREEKDNPNGFMLAAFNGHSQTFITSQARSKFQKNVKKILQLIKFSPLKQSLKKNRSAMLKKIQANNRMTYFNNNFYLSIELLLKRMDEKKLEETSYYSDLEYLILKLKLLNQSTYDQILYFEHMKFYENYMVNFNVNEVILRIKKAALNQNEKQETTVTSSQLLNCSPEERKLYLYQSLPLYMLYPNEYFKRFCEDSSKIRLTQVPHQQKDVKELVTRLREKQKRILKRKNAIAPEI